MTYPDTIVADRAEASDPLLAIEITWQTHRRADRIVDRLCPLPALGPASMRYPKPLDFKALDRVQKRRRDLREEILPALRRKVEASLIDLPDYEPLAPRRSTAFMTGGAQ